VLIMQSPTPTMNGPVAATPVGGPVFRPLRLNFAQVCYVCGNRWCDSPRCIAYHEASTWAVCLDCDGFDDACRCYGGLVEVYPQDAASFARSLSAAPPAEPVYRITERRVVDAPWGYA
jgi:hypothetical protein